MKICVGIISYFPDSQIRQNRINKCMEVLTNIYRIFDLPIVIVAQNWKDVNIPEHIITNETRLYKYTQRLGITGARRKLREIFLDSEFDYMVMLDDDSILQGTEADGELYLKQLEMHPGMWGAYKESLLKLFAISKEIYKQVEYPKGEAINGDFFEDMYIVKYCRKVFGNKEFRFPCMNLREISDSANDINSTWYHRQFNKHEMGDRTRAMIARL